MLEAAKFGDPVLGIDIHMVLVRLIRLYNPS